LHWALPSAVLPADTSLPCDRCEKGIQHPASAAVLACPSCDLMFFHPDLPDELRPRVDAIVAEQHCIGETIRQLSERLEQLPAPWRHHELNHLIREVRARRNPQIAP
jgi:hypothetical protein